MKGTPNVRWPFSGTVREMFRTAATIEIDSCPVLEKGAVLTVDHKDIAEQSFRTGIGRGDHVEGVVVPANDAPAGQKPYALRHVTKII